MSSLTRWIAIGVGIITVALIAFLVVAIINPGFREGSWQIAVTLLAVLQMISAFLMIAILFAILYTINALNKLTRERVLPRIDLVTGKVDELLETTRSIATNAREVSTQAAGATSLITEQIVAPVIRISGLVAGVRATATSLARRSGSRSNSPEA